ncbi:hypothetical protein ZWY2020_001744 [Hordeum vulgare]|nr:hypothetical protein ZWY2020_001744 [Hordeum vulgare]
MVGSDANRPHRGALLREELRQSFSAPTDGGDFRHEMEVRPSSQPSCCVSKLPPRVRKLLEKEESYAKGNFGGSGEDSEGLLHADDEVQADSDDGVVSLKPLPPYVGMKFDTLDDAEKLYNDYDCRLYAIDRDAYDLGELLEDMIDLANYLRDTIEEMTFRFTTLSLLWAP